MIEGPARMGALAEAPLNVEQAAFRSIDARMIGAVGGPVRRNRYDAWVDYDYGSRDVTGAFLSGDAKSNTIAAGGDKKLTDEVLVGIAFNYTEDKNDFGGGAGGFKLKETAATVYGGWGRGPGWVGATLGAGNLDFTDVRRTFALGPQNRTETAGTKGSHLMASVLGGYWFGNAGVLHGPYARLAWQEVNVDAFSENGSDSTALSYGKQKRRSFTQSVGWQVTGQVAMVRPFARVTWEHESDADARSVTASPIGLAGSYSVPTLAPDDNYVRYLVGAATDFGRVTGFVTGSGTSGRGDGNGYAFTVGVRVPL
jgi:outer membrane lipase/esterase